MDKCNLKQMFCNVCSKEFLSKNPNVQLIQHKRWCNKKHEFLNKYSLDPNSLTEEYKKCGSVLGFKEKFPFWDNFVHYYRLFRELGVSVSLKAAHNNEITKNKRTETFRSRYGFDHNFIRGTSSRNKWEKRLIEEEGITNVFQREDVKKKSLDTILDKYGKELWLHSITVRGSGIVSKLNKQVFEILEKNSINFSIEFKVKCEKRYYYSYDILIEGEKKIIEINGDYWHCNPRKYAHDHIYLKGSSREKTAKDKWKEDEDKINFIRDKGYQVLVIWEMDLKNDKIMVEKEILNFIRSRTYTDILLG